MEYEEKRANMSLTQAELDKENDYYCRQSSPLHEPDDGTFGDDLEDVVGTKMLSIDNAIFDDYSSTP